MRVSRYAAGVVYPAEAYTALICLRISSEVFVKGTTRFFGLSDHVAIYNKRVRVLYLS